LAEGIKLNAPTVQNGDVAAADEIGGQKYQRVKIVHGADGVNGGDIALANPLPVNDPWLQHAIDIIEADYGVVVSMQAKNKDLLKFGENDDVQTTLTTIQDFASGIYNETYLTDNLVDGLVSTDNGDTEDIVVEGHTVDGNGDFTFVSQTITLTGQTKVALTTNLARVTRMYNNGSTDLAGTVSAFYGTASAGGVPTTAANVKCTIPAGFNQSRKCSTTLSSEDYWVIQNIGISLLTKASAFASAEFEVREKGKVFRSRISIGGANGTTDHEYLPYYIVPANSDVRLRAAADQNGRSVSGHIQGVLLKVAT
jgi:hypothetical protein